MTGVSCTFRKLLETFECDVKGVWVSELCWVVLDGNVEDLCKSAEAHLESIGVSYVYDAHDCKKPEKGGAVEKREDVLDVSRRANESQVHDWFWK